MRLDDLWRSLKNAASDCADHHVSRLAAALAYYTLLSIAPLIVLAVAVVGLVFGEEAARGQISEQLSDVVGPHAATAIETIVANANAPREGMVSSAIGLGVLLFGASRVFGELQASLDTIWGVAPRSGRGLWGAISDRFFSFTMVLGAAFLLLVSTLLSALLAAAGELVGSLLPGEALLHLAVNALSFALTTGVFMLLFKVVPDVRVRFRDVWFGATLTAFLFVIGKFLLGLYLGKSSVSSLYGAAGSLVALVIWVYYSAQIFLLGAEFTQAYARTRGAHIEPRRDAVAIAYERTAAP